MRTMKMTSLMIVVVDHLCKQSSACQDYYYVPQTVFPIQKKMVVACAFMCYYVIYFKISTNNIYLLFNQNFIFQGSEIKSYHVVVFYVLFSTDGCLWL